MSDTRSRMADSVPAGSCSQCDCALSSISCERDGEWFCCGACAGSNRCSCGCRPEFSREITSDVYVPGRRMFGSRHPDELRTSPDSKNKQRAFPFADRHRGR